MEEKILSEKKIRNKNIIAFGVFVLCIAVAYFTWKGLRNQEKDNGAAKTLRKGFEINESIFSGVFDKNNLVKTYPISKAEKNVRVNGDIGMKEAAFDPASWKLKLVKDGGDTLFLTLDDIKKLPKKDLVFNFKCIEGWSEITWWGGVSFVDFANHYGLQKDMEKGYASLTTPGNQYYVGIDMPSMLQPQTILCYELNGQPLPMNQGYPLRLIIPVKYGIKHLKRIGTMYFSDTKPKDYWAERGYDYYSGH